MKIPFPQYRGVEQYSDSIIETDNDVKFISHLESHTLLCSSGEVLALTHTGKKRSVFRGNRMAADRAPMLTGLHFDVI